MTQTGADSPEARADTWSADEGDFPGPGGSLYRRRVLPAPSAVRPWARLVLLHGYGDHGGRYGHFLRWMAARGVACHNFDFRGHGLSAGRRGFVHRWEEFLDDLDSFLAYERRQPVSPAAGRGEGGAAGATNPAPPGDIRPPLFLLAHSHGGLVAAAAGIAGRLEIDGCAGCVLTSPYLRAKTPLSRAWAGFARVLDYLAPWLHVATGLRGEQMSSDPEMLRESRRDKLLLRVATPRWYNGTLKAQQEVMARAAEFRLPLLCLAGDADAVADPAAAAEFARRAGSPDRTFHAYPGRLHELLHEAGREGIFQTVHDWMRARASADAPPIPAERIG